MQEDRRGGPDLEEAILRVGFSSVEEFGRYIGRNGSGLRRTIRNPDRRFTPDVAEDVVDGLRRAGYQGDPWEIGQLRGARRPERAVPAGETTATQTTATQTVVTPVSSSPVAPEAPADETRSLGEIMAEARRGRPGAKELAESLGVELPELERARQGYDEADFYRDPVVFTTIALRIAEQQREILRRLERIEQNIAAQREIKDQT